MEQNRKTTSVIVVGGGPAGYSAAIRAAQLGADVTLIEREELGGTCLNRGCIPTKALQRSANAYRQAGEWEALGINVKRSFDWAQVQQYRAAVVKKLTDGVKSLIALNRIRLIQGEAAFVGLKCLLVNGQELSADRIILAAGSRNAAPDIPGLSECRVRLDSTQCLALPEFPGSLCVIGGGVVGLELASVYAAFGAAVTVLESRDEILPAVDRELTMRLRGYLKKRGVDIRCSAQVEKLENTDTGARITGHCPEEALDLTADRILVCTGRVPDLGSLQLDKTDVRTEQGAVYTDDRLESSCSGVYAAGDCTGRRMYAHAAIAMGVTAAENAMGGDRKFRDEMVPVCCFAGMELASAGYSEEQAKAEGIAYKTGRFEIIANGRSVVEGCTDGIVKVLAGEKYGEILGVQILAPNAAELIGEATLALGLEATLDELAETIHCHPTVSEALWEASLAAEGKAIHQFAKRR